MATAEFFVPQSACDEEVAIPVGHGLLGGRVRVPENPVGFVIFAHGTGTTRNSPHNRFIANVLADHALAVLTVDLLSPAETDDPTKAFDIALLGRRLTGVRDWLRNSPSYADLPVGYLGAGSDAPAALWAAAEFGAAIRAVVVRGARPDLAGARLVAVRAPTLLLAGGHDQRVHAANHKAAEAMRCEHRVTELTAPGHAWSEPRLSRWVAYLAAVWFAEHLASTSASGPEAEQIRPEWVTSPEESMGNRSTADRPNSGFSSGELPTD